MVSTMMWSLVRVLKKLFAQYPGLLGCNMVEA